MRRRFHNSIAVDGNRDDRRRPERIRMNRFGHRRNLDERTPGQRAFHAHNRIASARARSVSAARIVSSCARSRATVLPKGDSSPDSRSTSGPIDRRAARAIRAARTNWSVSGPPARITATLRRKTRAGAAAQTKSDHDTQSAPPAGFRETILAPRKETPLGSRDGGSKSRRSPKRKMAKACRRNKKTNPPIQKTREGLAGKAIISRASETRSRGKPVGAWPRPNLSRRLCAPGPRAA